MSCVSPIRAGSKSSSAACSAARARSSFAGCAGPESRASASRSSSLGSTLAIRPTTSSRTARCAWSRRSSTMRGSCSSRSSRTPRSSASTKGSSSIRTLPATCSALADRGVRVIVAGLDQDYLGKPFEPMPQLLAIAEYITKTHAICMVCGNPANHTQRLVAERRPRARWRGRPLRSALPPLLRSASLPDPRRIEIHVPIDSRRNALTPNSQSQRLSIRRSIRLAFATGVGSW